MGALVPQLAPVLATYQQAVAWFAPRTPSLSVPSAMPVFIHFSERGEFYGFPCHGARGIKVGGPHFARVSIDPEQESRDPTERQICELSGFVARHIPDAAGSPEGTSGCIYTVTPDEHFVLDRLPGAPQVLLVSPCSGHGYKFAPAIGEIVADLVVCGRTEADIAPFALARFAAPAMN
jgi:sarcosine oxidase